MSLVYVAILFCVFSYNGDVYHLPYQLKVVKDIVALRKCVRAKKKIKFAAEAVTIENRKKNVKITVLLFARY